MRALFIRILLVLAVIVASASAADAQYRERTRRVYGRTSTGGFDIFERRYDRPGSQQDDMHRWFGLARDGANTAAHLGVGLKTLGEIFSPPARSRHAQYESYGHGGRAAAPAEEIETECDGLTPAEWESCTEGLIQRVQKRRRLQQALAIERGRWDGSSPPRIKYRSAPPRDSYGEDASNGYPRYW